MGIDLRPTRTLRRAALLLITVAALTVGPAATASAADISDLLPAVSPPGANDFSCRPTAEHPEPIVLVHGTFEGAADNWAVVSPQLKAAGYCVFALDYGDRATGDIATSAAQLERFVDAVLAATGARKVSLVGHSQGGMMPRYYIKFLGGANAVDDLVGLAPSNHGTTLSGLAIMAGYFPGALPLVGALCPACTDQVKGSPFITALNAGGDTVAGVKYTVIQSRYDEVVTPYSSAFLSGADVTNITIQDVCFLDGGEHLSMTSDHIVGRQMLNALDPAHAQSTLCSPIVPAVGG
jgi:triacylglycerol esterase/lipase EstA (alpha/beta hydrolase family)